MDYQDVYEQSGVFISVKDEESGGSDILLGGTLYIAEAGEKIYVKWIAYQEPDRSTPDKENTYTLRDDSSSVLHSTEHTRERQSSTSEYVAIDPDWTLVSGGDQMVAFLKVDRNGRRIQRGSLSSDAESTNEEVAKYNMSVEVAELDQMKRSKKGLGWPSVTLRRKDGSHLPTFHFHHKGCKRFIKTLKTYSYALPSSKDPNTFQLSHHDDNALTRSFDELQLFGGQSPLSDHSKLLKDPSGFALRSFSKVTNFLQDMFVPNDNQNRPASETADVICDESMEAGASRIQIRHSETQSESNGFEVITCAQLGPRPEEPRAPPVTKALLETHRDLEGRILRVDELRWAIFKGGIDPELRKVLWKYLLKYYDWNMTAEEVVQRRKAKEEDYYRMKMQWKSIDEEQQKRFSTLRERKCLIEKDVIRTDRTRMFYKEDDTLSLKLLFDILMTYCMYNFDLGYVQGMSDLLSPLLEVLGNEVDTFWCFVGYMDLVHHNFEANQAGMKRQLGDLRTLLQFMEPQLWDHLNEKESSNLYFCFRWLLIHFKREFSYEDIQSLWEVLWTGLPCYNFHLLICLAILETEKHKLIKPECGFTEILKHINDLSGDINIEDTLRKAYGTYLQLSPCKQDLPDSVRHILGLTD